MSTHDNRPTESMSDRITEFFRRTPLAVIVAVIGLYELACQFLTDDIRPLFGALPLAFFLAYSATSSGGRKVILFLASRDHRWQTGMATCGLACVLLIVQPQGRAQAVPVVAAGHVAVAHVKFMKVVHAARLAVLPATLRAALVNSGVSASEAIATANIERAFRAYGEPYAGDTALLVQVAHGFGVDPALVAGLFLHEDGNINNRAEFPQHMNWLLYHDHNPGNIKCMYDPCYQGFQVYPTYRAGILDWFRLYDHYYFDLGIHDLGSFVRTYCPGGVDGNGPPSEYQGAVHDFMTEIKAGW